MTLECGIVADIIQEDDTVQILNVDLSGSIEKALNYKDIYGRIEIGQKVYLNTTAVRLKLGSGGFHFVLWHDAMHVGEIHDSGHIMRLPYTPWQFGCLSVEEDDSAYHSAFTRECTLDGMPVIICELHSMLAPTTAVLKYIGFDTLAYIMTDRACLPIAFSDTVKELRRKELLDYTITVGNAFGGDYEAVNLYTALITAHSIAGADAAIVAIGPGIIGTGTVYGFSTLEQGHYIDDVNALRGRAIFMPRISFADLRSRHIGISHHSLTALSLTAHTQAEVYMPILPKEQMRIVISQIESSNLFNRHRWRFRDGNCIGAIMERYGLHVTTMGRSYNDDPAFFKAAGALKNI